MYICRSSSFLGIYVGILCSSQPSDPLGTMHFLLFFSTVALHGIVATKIKIVAMFVIWGIGFHKNLLLSDGQQKTDCLYLHFKSHIMSVCPELNGRQFEEDYSTSDEMPLILIPNKKYFRFCCQRWPFYWHRLEWVKWRFIDSSSNDSNGDIKQLYIPPTWRS